MSKPNKTDDMDGKAASPRPFEIVPVPSVRKRNMELDQRTGRATSLSFLLGIALFISALVNVYQAISRGDRVEYAQELRTGAFTELPLLPPEKIDSAAKVGPPPSYSDEFLAKQDEIVRQQEAWLASFFVKRANTPGESSLPPGAAASAGQAGATASPQSTPEAR